LAAAERRRRKRRPGGAAGSAGAAPPRAAAPSRPATEANAAMRRGYARSREKDEAVRAALKPIEPGERPWPIVVCAVLAAVFAVANLALLAAGWEIDGEDPPVAGTLIFSGVMLAAAVGMWQLRYWAVLGFEVLLGVTMVGAMLSLLRAANTAAVALSLAVIAVTFPLFWLLIRQMARIQMPRRPPPRDRVG
jgi:hypothetical protein